MFNGIKMSVICILVSFTALISGCGSSGGNGNTDSTGSHSFFQFLFVGQDTDHGAEIWHSDGTPEGTQLLKDTNPLGSGAPNNFTQVGDTTFFTADDGIHGFELWKRDGTGVSMVADINPTGSSGIRYMTSFKGELYFILASGNAQLGLWKSDGTAAGTVFVTNTIPSNYTFRVESTTAYLYFIYSSNIYRTDGTAIGTSKMQTTVSTGERYSNVYDQETINDTLYFVASSYDATPSYISYKLWLLPDTASEPQLLNTTVSLQTRSNNLARLNDKLLFISSNNQLWQTDGTVPGTTAILDINDQPVSAYYSYGLTTAGTKVYFYNTSRHLQVTDGTAAGTLQISSVYGPPIVGTMNGAVYFKVTNTSPVSTWYSDGTVAGTVKLGDINAYSGTSWNGSYYFSTYSDNNGIQSLWKSNGSVGTTMKIKDFNSPVGESLSITQLFAATDRLLFNGYDASRGFELWQSDGTEIGTDMLMDVNHSHNASGQPYGYVVLNQRAYFITYGAQHGYAIWATDGTPEGTVIIKDGFSDIYELVATNNKVYFAGTTVADGSELWATDGTTSGTGIVVDFYPGPDSSSPNQLTAANNLLYFVMGNYLWKTDGTEAGTDVVSLYYPEKIYSQGDKVFFTSYGAGDTGRELWVTMGSLSTTHIVKDINPDGNGVVNATMIAFGGNIYFAADDGVNGEEIWKSDGTEAGTEMVANLDGNNDGIVNFDKDHYAFNNNELYFIGRDINGNEQLYKTDGTESGTVALTDDTSTIDPSHINYMSAFNGKVYLSAAAFDAANDYGYELCVTDGTPEGTGLLKDINPSGSSNPYGFRVANGYLFFFAGDDSNQGNTQLWRTDGTEAGTIKLRDNLDMNTPSWELEILVGESIAR